MKIYLKISYFKRFVFFCIESQDLGPWIPAIINHLYWSVLSCSGNGQILTERFVSIIHHICNRHIFSDQKIYKRCSHSPYSTDETRRKAWLKMGSPLHDVLKKVVLEKQLVKDFSKMNLQIYTTYLEVFHAVKIRYLPKSIYFNIEKMIAGTQLAALDHNHNVGREQVGYIFNFL